MPRTIQIEHREPGVRFTTEAANSLIGTEVPIKLTEGGLDEQGKVVAAAVSATGRGVRLTIEVSDRVAELLEGQPAGSIVGGPPIDTTMPVGLGQEDDEVFKSLLGARLALMQCESVLTAVHASGYDGIKFTDVEMVADVLARLRERRYTELADQFLAAVVPLAYRNPRRLAKLVVDAQDGRLNDGDVAEVLRLDETTAEDTSGGAGERQTFKRVNGERSPLETGWDRTARGDLLFTLLQGGPDQGRPDFIEFTRDELVWFVGRALVALSVF